MRAALLAARRRGEVICLLFLVEAMCYGDERVRGTGTYGLLAAGVNKKVEEILSFLLLLSFPLSLPISLHVHGFT